jgi:hypothetical protein
MMVDRTIRHPFRRHRGSKRSARKMRARMKNPGVVIRDAMTAIRALNEAIKQGGVPQRTLDPDLAQRPFRGQN